MGILSLFMYCIYNFVIPSSLNICVAKKFEDHLLLQSLKESMLSEQHILSQQLQQEKLSLASEKSRLDTLARLHGATSPELSKVV
jgi:hypothetical protein